MTDFSESAWVALGCIAACGILAMLHLVASAIRNLTYMHDLKHQVYRLKVEYEARKKAMNEPPIPPGAGTIGEVDIVDDEPVREAA
jgi:hypothetical protein